MPRWSAPLGALLNAEADIIDDCTTLFAVERWPDGSAVEGATTTSSTRFRRGTTIVDGVFASSVVKNAAACAWSKCGPSCTNARRVIRGIGKSGRRVRDSFHKSYSAQGTVNRPTWSGRLELAQAIVDETIRPVAVSVNLVRGHLFVPPGGACRAIPCAKRSSEPPGITRLSGGAIVRPGSGRSKS